MTDELSNAGDTVEAQARHDSKSSAHVHRSPENSVAVEHLADVAWLPPESCFWALLDLKGVRSGPFPDTLRTVLAEELPLSEEDIHAICEPTTHGLLVCAVPKSLLVTIPHSITRLTPRSIPTWPPERFDPKRLNLLVGEFEPPAHRRLRRQRATALAMSISLVAIIAGVGFHRRAVHLSANAIELTTALKKSIDVAAGSPHTVQDFREELESMRKEVSTAAQRPSVPDAAADIDRLLAAWPVDSQCDVQSLAVGPDGANAIVEVPNPLAAAFLSSIKAAPGWHLDEPRLQSIRRGDRQLSQFSLRWRRETNSGSQARSTR